jgi:hypothetical protein
MNGVNIVRRSLNSDMAKPEQTLIWTILPNGIRGSKLKFSVALAPQFKNPTPADVPLSQYPDFLDWPRTLKRNVSFELTFNAGPPIVEGVSGSKLKRIDPPFLTTLGVNAWKEIFATASDAKLRPIVRSFDAQNSDLPQMKVVPFSTEKTLNAVQGYYDEAKKLINTSPAPDQEDRKFAHVVRRDFDKDRSQKLGEYLRREYGEAFGPGGMSTKLVSAINNRIAARDRDPSVSFTDPPPGISANAFQIGLANYFHAVLQNKPKTKPPAKELEFHKTVAGLFSLPLLSRHLGLVIDFELDIGSAKPPDGSGKVKIVPKWNSNSTVVARNDVSPWTAYDLTAGVFQARRKGPESDVLNGYLPIGPPLVPGPAKYYLEQRDALAEAIKLLGQIVAAIENEDERLHVTPPRALAIALLKVDLDTSLKQSMKDSQDRLKSLQSGSGADIMLFADDLIRGYRMDINRMGTWRSLHSRNGDYNFLNREVIEKLGQDEGWVAKSAVRVGTEENLPDRLAVHDVVSKWEGWSLAAPKPGAPLPSKPDSPKPEPPRPEKELSTYKVRFSAAEHSLPSLRFGEQYLVRVRLADLAGNGPALTDPFGDNRDVVSQPITFFRYDAIPSPDVIPRSDLSSAPGENAITLVIRSNYNTRCSQTSERFIAPPRTAEIMAEMHGKFDRNFRVDASHHSTIKNHDKDSPAVEPDDEYDVPYLSDPIASAAILRNLPGAEEFTFTEFTIPNEWPKVKAWRLQVLEHPDTKVPADDFLPVFKPPVKIAPDLILKVFLPKAVVASFPLTSRITETDLKLMGLWNEVEQTSPSPDFTRNVLEGKNPLFTPAKTLRLVHAVQQPLFEPRFSGDLVDISVPQLQRRNLSDAECIKVRREPNSTYATLNADVRMPGLSAETYKINGSWLEAKDDGKTFQLVKLNAVAFGGTLDNVDHKLSIEGRHEFNDTKHREITYEVSAKTRFEQYLSVPPGAPLTRESRRVRIHVPNSAVPPPPEIQYIVPTFGWEPQQTTTTTVTKRRRGGGLRVYLNHRWYETGTDEQLGVRVAIGSDDVEEDDLQVSRWGRDPISSVTGPGTLLSEAALKGDNADREELAEGARRVAVVGYAVRYDQQRNLWFCDLEIDPGRAYFPFIRFALTRFQPYSLKNFSCSPTVVSDFCQLAPDRTISFRRDLISAPFRRIENLRLTGQALVSTNEVTLTLERGRRNESGEVRWEQAKNPVKLQFVNAGGGAWTLDQFVLRPDQTFDPQLDDSLLRLVVKEYENIVDDTVAGSDTTTIARLVYADTVLEV